MFYLLRQEEKTEKVSEQEAIKDQPKKLPRQQVPQPDSVFNTEKLEHL